jgi:hypothetical protein
MKAFTMLAWVLLCGCASHVVRCDTGLTPINRSAPAARPASSPGVPAR